MSKNTRMLDGTGYMWYCYRMTTHDRFTRKYVTMPTGCFQWIAYVNPWGYGGFNVRGRMVYAHRWAYEQSHGPIPKGTKIHHLCENKLCVNPSHLAAVTLAGHNAVHRKAWAINAAKTHCIHGHAFTEANTYLTRGERHCRACNRESAARYRECHRQ